MLLRIYRLTDKLGVLILKLGAASADYLLEGISALAGLMGQGFGGFFAIIAIIASFFWAIIKGIGKAIWAIIKSIGSIIKRIAGSLAKLLSSLGITSLNLAKSRSTSNNNSALSDNPETMARRAAREETDVIMKEDPLRTQNRRLSFLVLILGVGVLVAVIWATDPNRIQQALPVAIAPANDTSVTNDPTEIAVNIVAPTQIPTATPLPDALRSQGAIAYTVRERGQTDIWAVNVGSRNPIRITNDEADERDPEWSPSGTRLAYAARLDGNWDLYVYDALQDATGRVTVDLSFQANPTWSPDGALLAYENYQNDNLNIYAVPIDASIPPAEITSHPAPDFSPAWGPDGRNIAFVSLRDGNQDIYIINLDSLEIINITNTANLNEDYPAWSPDGRSIAYSVREEGALSETVYVQSLEDLGEEPELIAIGRTPAFSPDGNSLTYVVDTRDNSRTDIYAITLGEAGLPSLIGSVLPNSTAPTWTLQPLPAQLINSGGLPLGVDDPLYVEQADVFDGSDFQLQSLGNVQTDQAFLSDAVNDSFNAFRQAILEDSGLDYLGVLDDAFWRLDRPADLGEPGRNWHRTGRAFAIQRNGVRGFPPPIEVIRENIGNEVYWRIFVRVDENSQRGQLGEPLRDLPWDFLSTDQGDVDAFNQGGRLRREVPTGYYIDFTLLASDYDWERTAAGTDWVANERARNFWLYINDDNLTWCEAMLQLYSEGQLVNYACTE